MADEVETLLRCEERERDPDEFDHVIEGAWSERAQEGFQLRKRLLDRIEIRTVGWQKPQLRADLFDGRLDLGLFVHGQVIEDDDVAGPERWHQDLFDVGEKCWIVERAIEDRWGVQAIDA